MMHQLQRLFWLTGMFSVVLASVAQADTLEVSSISGVSAVSAPEVASAETLEHSEDPEVATTVEDWLSQIEAQAQPSEASTELAQTLTEITNIQVGETADGLELILEATTPVGEPQTSVVGNALVAEIPNAVLSLAADEAFEQFDPAPGIALVSVTNLPNNRVQISITGTEAPPQAEISATTGNLVLSVVPGVATVADADADDEAIQVVVSATRTEQDILNVPRSVTVITREELERQSRLTPNFYDSLGTLVPGLGPPNQSDRTNAQSLRGRGALFLIDGVPVEANLLGGNGLRGLDPAIVERVEVVRGPSGLYGSGASGGVINIITRRPEEGMTSRAELGLSAALGELNGDSFAYDLGYGFSGTDGRFDVTINLDAQFTNQFYDAEGDVIPQSTPTLAESTVLSGFGRLGFELTDEQRVQLSVNHVSDRRDANNISDPIVRTIPGRQKARALTDEIEFDGVERPGSRLTNIDLNYTHGNLWGSRLQAQAYFYSGDIRTLPFDDRGGFLGNVVSSEFRAEAYGGRLQVETPITQSLELLWGADYRNERNERIADILDPIAFDRDRVARFVDELVVTPPYFLDQLGLFAQLQWELSPNFTLSGGIRQEFLGLNVADYTTIAGDNIEGGEVDFDATVFNIGAVYRATDNLSLFASFSQGFSAPVFAFLAGPPPGFSVNGGFEEIQPQTVDNYEIGVRGQWGNVQASLAGFYAYSDLGASLRPVPGTPIRRSVRAPQRNYGIEATLDWQPAEQWRLGGTFTWNEGESDTNDDGEFLALSSFSVQPWKLTAYVEHQTTPTWSNRLQLLYSGNRNRGFESGADRVPIEEYITFDLISQLQLGEGTLTLGVENLLDTQYFPVFAQRLSGFNDANYRAARGRRVSLTYSFSW